MRCFAPLEAAEEDSALVVFHPPARRDEGAVPPAESRASLFAVFLRRPAQERRGDRAAHQPRADDRRGGDGRRLLTGP